MKKLLLAISMVGLMGCSQADNKVFIDIQNKMEYGVDLSAVPDVQHEMSLLLEEEYEVVEQYGAVAYKAIDACYSKYEYMMDGVDSSSDYGSTVLHDMQQNSIKCMKESLSVYDEIPVNHRQHIPRDNVGLELSDDEIESFNELPAFDYDENDPRYPEIKQICEENNAYVLNPVDRSDAVEFCVRKAM